MDIDHPDAAPRRCSDRSGDRVRDVVKLGVVKDTLGPGIGELCENIEAHGIHQFQPYLDAANASGERASQSDSIGSIIEIQGNEHAVAGGGNVGSIRLRHRVKTTVVGLV
jgi:hypothetical protein